MQNNMEKQAKAADSYLEKLDEIWQFAEILLMLEKRKKKRMGLFFQDDIVLNGHTGIVRHLAFHPLYENILISSGSDQTLKIWDMSTGKRLFEVQAHRGIIYKTLPIIHNKMVVLITCSSDSLIKFWELRRKEIVKRTEETEETKDQEIENQYLFSLSLLSVFTVHRASVRDLTVINDKIVASCGWDGRINLISIAKRKAIASMSLKKKEFCKLAYYPGKNWLIAGTSVGNIAIFDLGERSLVYLLNYKSTQSQCSYIFNLMLFKNPINGKDYLVYTTMNIHLLNLEDLTDNYSFEGHNNQIRGLCYIEDAEALVTVGCERSVFFWKLGCDENDRLVLSQNECKGKHSDFINVCSFNNRSKFATGCWDGSINLYTFSDS